MERLETSEALLGDFVRALELEEQQLWRAYRDLREAARQLVRDERWQGGILAVELLDRTLELGARLESELPEDREWRIRETAADMRQLLEAMREERERDRLHDPPAAAHYVALTLVEADQERLASLVGVDVRTLRTWRSRPPSSLRKRADRVVLLAQLVGELSRSLTPRGVVLWLSTPHPELDGHTPRDLLDDPAAQGALTTAAGALVASWRRSPDALCDTWIDSASQEPALPPSCLSGDEDQTPN